MKAITRLSGLTAEGRSGCGWWKRGELAALFTCKVRCAPIGDADRGVLSWCPGSSPYGAMPSTKKAVCDRQPAAPHRLPFQARSLGGVSGNRPRDRQALPASWEYGSAWHDSRAGVGEAWSFLNNQSKLFPLTDCSHRISAKEAACTFGARGKVACLMSGGAEQQREIGRVWVNCLASAASSSSARREPCAVQCRCVMRKKFFAPSPCLSSVSSSPRPAVRAFRPSDASGAASFSSSALSCPFPSLPLSGVYSCGRTSDSSDRCSPPPTSEPTFPSSRRIFRFSPRHLLPSSSSLCRAPGCRLSQDSHTPERAVRDGFLWCFSPGQDGVLTRVSPTEKFRLFFLQRRWWTRCSGMRKPV